MTNGLNLRLRGVAADTHKYGCNGVRPQISMSYLALSLWRNGQSVPTIVSFNCLWNFLPLNIVKLNPLHPDPDFHRARDVQYSEFYNGYEVDNSRSLLTRRAQQRGGRTDKLTAAAEVALLCVKDCTTTKWIKSSSTARYCRQRWFHQKRRILAST